MAGKRGGGAGQGAGATCRYGARPRWPGRAVPVRRDRHAVAAATEPGRDGREEFLMVFMGTSWTLPLRSPAAMAGKRLGLLVGQLLAGGAATEPGRDGREEAFVHFGQAGDDQPLRSPAAMAGKRVGVPAGGVVEQLAATEPGRDGREEGPAGDQCDRGGQQAATEPGRDGREEPPGTLAVPAACRTRRYGARPRWPGRGRATGPCPRPWCRRYGARPRWPGRVVRHVNECSFMCAATEPGRDGREESSRISGVLTCIFPVMRERCHSAVSVGPHRLAAGRRICRLNWARALTPADGGIGVLAVKRSERRRPGAGAAGR